jgi:hypothetical protein
LIPLVTQPLSSVPAMSRFGVQVLNFLAGDPAGNMISIVDDVSNANLVAQAMQDGYFLFPTRR